MNKYCTLVILILFGIICNSQEIRDKKYARKNLNSKTIKLVNGNWFDGKTFKKRTVWLKDGLINFNDMERRVDTIINLSGNYIIPPFAEAHNHNLESRHELDKRIKSYLDNGVFYVKLLSTIKKRIQAVMHNYNNPTGLDVSMAHAPLTAKDGHPMGVRKRYLNFGYYSGMFNSLEELEFHGFVTINDKKDLVNKWKKVISTSPDFIKIMLLYSEEYEKRKDDTLYFARKGLNPKLVSEIIKRAHKSDLRVSAHVETAYDFHVAVKSGIDEIAHLPEISNGQPITIEDIKLAKEKNVIIVTTASLVLKRQNRPDYKQLVKNIVLNLKLLRAEGVMLAIGSDQYNGNSTEEFDFLYQLNVFSNLELLRMWTVNAAKTIFPHRKIGELKEGYEASFLVLDKNPIKDIANVYENISMRIKQGVILE